MTILMKMEQMLLSSRQLLEKFIIGSLSADRIRDSRKLDIRIVQLKKQLANVKPLLANVTREARYKLWGSECTYFEW